MGIEILSHSMYPQWDSFVSGKQDGTFYHLSYWGTAIKDAYGLDYFVIVARDNGVIVCGTPLVIIKYCLRKYAYSMPYVSHASFCGGDETIRREIQGFLLDIFDVYFIEFRELRSRSEAINSLVTQVLDLRSGNASLWNKLDSAERSSVRKALRGGLTISSEGNNLSIFYRLFAEKMRRLGTPPHSEKMFSSLVEYGRRNVHLLTVKLKGEIIGGMFLGHVGDRLYNPWVAMNDDYRYLSCSDFLYWSAIEWACEKGFRYFDLGRSRRGSGVYRFKRKWGAEDVGLCYRRIFKNGSVKNITGHIGESYPVSVAASIWKRLPCSISTLAGSYLRKYIP
jgi:serine/alanine adding enzyme